MSQRTRFIVGTLLIVLFGYGLFWWFGMHQPRPAVSTESLRPSDDTRTLALATPAETLALENGQTLDLTIAPVKHTINGQAVTMLGYNGSLPGPTLRVKQGTEVSINLKNGGDIPTTLHAHGIRMENAFDGVPGMTQEAIAPGETFVYRLKFPDAGAFWYHPHVRTDYTVEAGLYGSILVAPAIAAYWPPVNREVPLMLDDIALDANGLLSFDAKIPNHTLMGRFGTTMLVNGATDYRLEAKAGEIVRLYLTNAANTRLFNFSIPGTRLKLIGADGGRYEQETFVESVLLAPGERRIVDVLFETPGTYPLQHTTPEKTYALGTVSVSTDNASPSWVKEYSTLRKNASDGDELRRLITAHSNRSPDKQLSLLLDMSAEMRRGMPQGMHMMGDGMGMSDAGMGMGDDGEAFEWEDTMARMNTLSTSETLEWKLVDTMTGKKNMAIDNWIFQQGDQVKIRIFNDPQSMHPMQHPIHFHGQRFIVLATNGKVNETPVWLDTTLIAKGDTVDILLDASNPGEWMAHCHILEHAEGGMMMPFTVVGAKETKMQQ